MMGEVGEVSELLQWLPADEAAALVADEPLHGRVADELADVFIYLIQLAEVCGVDLVPTLRTTLASSGWNHAMKSPQGGCPSLEVLPDANPSNYRARLRRIRAERNGLRKTKGQYHPRMNLVFNPPPGWPPPPVGWRPPPGWWPVGQPTPPPDWKFWAESSDIPRVKGAVMSPQQFKIQNLTEGQLDQLVRDSADRIAWYFFERAAAMQRNPWIVMSEHASAMQAILERIDREVLQDLESASELDLIDNPVLTGQDARLHRHDSIATFRRDFKSRTRRRVSALVSESSGPPGSIPFTPSTLQYPVHQTERTNQSVVSAPTGVENLRSGTSIVDSAEIEIRIEFIAKSIRRRSVRSAWISGIVFGVGAVLTASSLLDSSPSVAIFWGAIVFGGIALVRALLQYHAARAHAEAQVRSRMH